MSRRTSRYNLLMYLQDYTLTRDAAKQNVKTWANLTEFWGKLDFAYKGEEILSGSRRNETPELASSSEVWISLRLRNDVTFSPRYRIVYEGRIFNIVSFYKSLQRREIRVLCREVQT